MKRLCIATGTRADWGILQPLAEELRRRDKLQIAVLPTNMHLMEKYGHTIDDITGAGFEVSHTVEMPDANGTDSAAQRVIAMGRCLEGCAKAFEALSPDAVMILGDRFEMLAVASAAAVMNIPIIHLHGGEISEGAIDDSMRHAISKLSTLHLTSTEPYRRRVIQLGENPQRVINTGALGVWNLMHQTVPVAKTIYAELGLDAEKPVVVATCHSETLASKPSRAAKAMIEGLKKFPQLQIVITYPNNDPGSDAVIKLITDFAAENASKVKLVKSLGMKKFIGALNGAAFMIGNSSSGIIEAPSAHIPSINIGDRQKGRLRADSVIDCPSDGESVAKAIEKALSPEFIALAQNAQNPYCKDNTLALAADEVEKFMLQLPVAPKSFYDL